MPNQICNFHAIIEKSTEDRVVKGFVSMNNLDRHDDTIPPEAFMLERFENNPQLLFNHKFWKDANGNERNIGQVSNVSVARVSDIDDDKLWGIIDIETEKQVGVFSKSVSPDVVPGARGLWVEAHIDVIEVWKMVENGDLNTFSWKGLAQLGEAVIGGVRRVIAKSIDLIEASLVFTPANGLATFEIAKGVFFGSDLMTNISKDHEIERFEVNQVMFSKNIFTQKSAERWLIDHDLIMTPLSEEVDELVSIQEEEKSFDEDRLFSVGFATGVQVVVGKKKDTEEVSKQVGNEIDQLDGFYQLVKCLQGSKINTQRSIEMPKPEEKEEIEKSSDSVDETQVAETTQDDSTEEVDKKEDVEDTPAEEVAKDSETKDDKKVDDKAKDKAQDKVEDVDESKTKADDEESKKEDKAPDKKDDVEDKSSDKAEKIIKDEATKEDKTEDVKSEEKSEVEKSDEPEKIEKGAVAEEVERLENQKFAKLMKVFTAIRAFEETAFDTPNESEELKAIVKELADILVEESSKIKSLELNKDVIESLVNMVSDRVKGDITEVLKSESQTEESDSKEKDTSTETDQEAEVEKSTDDSKPEDTVDVSKSLKDDEYEETPHLEDNLSHLKDILSTEPSAKELLDRVNDMGRTAITKGLDREESVKDETAKEDSNPNDVFSKNFPFG